MEKQLLTIAQNINIAPSVYKMKLTGDTKSISAPGQFVNILLEGFYLRRPISVYDSDEESVELIYKIVGKGTQKTSELKSGEKLDVLLGLGNGYDLSKSGKTPLLIGGGVGVPPLYKLAKELVKSGCMPWVILGFNTANEIFCKDEFEKLGLKTYITTADGSEGLRGFVTDAMDAKAYSYVYTCGPLPMLRAVYEKSKTGGQFSFEERMGCGFGACMGCSCKTKYGNKRICKDGPVLEKEEIIW